MYSKVRAKFPCGMEYEIEFSAMFGSGEFQADNDIECPLHGKECKKLD